MLIDERIEKFARFTLAILLLVTMGWASHSPAKEQGADAPLILVAKPGLRDAFFGATILLVKPMGGDRHIGFVINRPTTMTLGKLFPEHAPSQRVPDPVFLGGPVNTEIIFALVQANATPSKECLQIGKDLFVAIDGKTVDQVIERDPAHARFFAGLVAWQPGELQEELKRGLWYALESDSNLVMRKSTDGLWEELVIRSERSANTI